MELSRSIRLLVNLVPVLLMLCSDCEATDSGLSYVTCGSLVKLLNTRHNVRLHSHDVKYGSGKLQRALISTELDPGEGFRWVSLVMSIVFQAYLVQTFT